MTTVGAITVRMPGCATTAVIPLCEVPNSTGPHGAFLLIAVAAAFTEASPRSRLRSKVPEIDTQRFDLTFCQFDCFHRRDCGECFFDLASAGAKNGGRDGRSSSIVA